MSCPPGGCSENDGQSQAPLARIDAVTAKVVDFAPRVTLTGTIQAQVQNDLSFRLSGRIIERNVDIGDHVTPIRFWRASIRVRRKPTWKRPRRACNRPKPSSSKQPQRSNARRR
jgi:Membrane-fusion protein